MSQVAHHKPQYMNYDRAHEEEKEHVSGWVGWIGFASVMMMLAGIFQAIAGLVAIFQDKFFVVSSNQLLVIHDIQTWGWVNFIVGSIVVLAGLSLLSGSGWARTIAVMLAVLSAVANMVSISLYPVWSVLCITIAILTIYAIVVHGGELKE